MKFQRIGFILALCCCGLTGCGESSETSDDTLTGGAPNQEIAGAPSASAGAGGESASGDSSGGASSSAGQAGMGGNTMAMDVPLECERPANPPNILFIFADDQAYNTVHAHGFEEVQTPNIDKLAERGVSFTHSYNQGSWSGAVCLASRRMLNTGRFVWKAKAANMGDEVSNGRLWSMLLREAGYQTFMAGKWHVPEVQPSAIFDHSQHVRPGMPMTVNAAYDRPVEGETDDWSPYDTSLGGYWAGGKHWSEVLADDAEEFFGQVSDDPFFMYLAFNAPHDPRQAPKEYVDRYPEADIAVPESFLPEYPYKDAMGAGPGLRDEKLAPFPRTEYSVRVHRGEYYALITHMDAQIGRILAALEASGKADNTIILFTADHGLSVGHHGLMGKQNMFEHSLRVPLIVAGPGLPENARVNAPVYLQDIMPTSLELAGRDVPAHVDFTSLLPLMCGETTTSSYPGIYGAYLDRQRMASDGEFKLIRYPTIDRSLLFDLTNDPQEMTDLADDPTYAGKLTELEGLLQQLEIAAGG